jgi:hypothetical protein
MPNYAVGQSQEVGLKDFAPDLDPCTPGIIIDCNNFIPTVKGYKARNSSVQYAPALPDGERPIGGYVAEFRTGDSAVYAGTGAHLYRLDSGAWTQVGSGYTATSRWRFAQFKNRIIAVAEGVKPQVAQGPTGNFTVLSNDAPDGATNIVSVASLIFMTRKDFWFNSGIGDDTDWVPDIQTQAATGQFTDFNGPVVALAPLFRNIIVFKQTSILLAQLTGGVSIWNFQLLSDETGTMCQESVVPLPESVAFLGTDDFYITTGNVPQRIPNNLKEWFFDKAHPSHFNDMLSWYDHTESTVYWHFVSTDNNEINNLPVDTPGNPDLWISYNIRAGKWSKGIEFTQYVVPNSSPKINDGLFFALNGTLKTWTGTPGQSWLKTGYVGDPGRLTQVMRVRPKYNLYPVPPVPNMTADLIIPFHTNVLGKPPIQDNAAWRGADGWHYYRSYDRYHQVQLNTNGPAEVVAMSAEIRAGGVR